MIALGNVSMLLLFLLLFGGCKQDISLQEAEEQNIHFAESPYLVAVEEVHAMLKTSSSPLLIEVSKEKSFVDGHLPGAHNLWRSDYGDDEHYPFGGMRASREKMTKLLGRLGAVGNKPIIVYCAKGSADATRLQWILRGYGHDQVMVMDGGKEAWRHAGFQLSQAPPSTSPTNYHFPEPEKEGYFISIKEVVAAISDTNSIVLDAREDYEYFGMPYISKDSVVQFKHGAFARGAIPGARHLNWSEAVDLSTDHTFKSLADLNHNFFRRGITPEKRIVVYCHSGVRSAHTTFVLKELLHYPDVKNYDGSWIEWSHLHQHDTLGKLQQYISDEEATLIYQDLLATVASAKKNTVVKE